MVLQNRSTVHELYAEAMRYSGPEATARLSIADRIAEATQEAIIREARAATPRVRPIVVSLGGLLVRIGERLEATGAVKQAGRRREYA